MMNSNKAITKVTSGGRITWTEAKSFTIPQAPAWCAMREDQEKGVADNDPEMVLFTGVSY